MHNRLIFLYHHVRAHDGPGLLRGCSFGDELTHLGESSNEGTQEGR